MPIFVLWVDLTSSLIILPSTVVKSKGPYLPKLYIVSPKYNRPKSNRPKSNHLTLSIAYCRLLSSTMGKGMSKNKNGDKAAEPAPAVSLGNMVSFWLYPLTNQDLVEIQLILNILYKSPPLVPNVPT